MIYKVLDIIEPDFGCEGLPDGQVPMDEVAFDLLEKMLRIDPIKRISCKDALNHVSIVVLCNIFYYSPSLMMSYSMWIMEKSMRLISLN